MTPGSAVYPSTCGYREKNQLRYWGRELCSKGFKLDTVKDVMMDSANYSGFYASFSFTDTLEKKN